MTLEGEIVTIEPDFDWGYFAMDDGEVNGFRLSLLRTDQPVRLGLRIVATVEDEAVVNVIVARPKEISMTAGA